MVNEKPKPNQPSPEEKHGPIPKLTAFLPQPPLNKDIKLSNIKESVRELKKGIKEYKMSEESSKRQNYQKRLSMADFVANNYIPQCRMIDLKMQLILYRQQYNKKLLKSIIQKLDAISSK